MSRPTKRAGSLSGGHLSEIPEPHTRFFGKWNRQKRVVTATVTTWKGLAVGAKHWRAKLKEEDNPIWNPIGGYPDGHAVWQLAWDDEDGKGRKIEQEFVRSSYIEAWFRRTFEREFSPKTHKLLMEPRAKRWLGIEP